MQQQTPDTKTNIQKEKLNPGKFLLRLLFIILYPGVILLILLQSAGKLWWIEAWIFTCSYALYFIIFFIWGTLKFPDLLAERASPKKNVKTWDKILMRFVYPLLLVVSLITCGIDVHRLQFSRIPLYLKITGGIFAAFAGALILWVLVTNRFASGFVRIQADRGHKVITTGPYKLIRHPMYFGVIFFILSIPMILGSWLGFIPAGLITILFFFRTYFEDKTLQEELEGYKEYTQKTKKRLIPGIW